MKVWSTADIHPRDRISCWIDALCEGVHVETTLRPGGPFFGAFCVMRMGGVRLQTVTSVGQTIVRRERHLGRDEPHFCFIVQTSGRGRISQDGRDAELDPGDLALTDSTRPFQLDFNREFSQSVLQIPRELLLSRVGPAERFTANRIDGRRGLARLLSPMLQSLERQLHDIPIDTHERVGGNAIDLIATALLSESGETPISAAMTRVRVKFWIETHLADDLSGERIAAACRLSVRHLNRLFAGEGTSLMQHVWERRLAHCRRNLLAPRMSNRPIGEIALAAGFKDLSHFSRAYRVRFGRTARDDRAAPDPRYRSETHVL
jgi:AraC-like DNA-binding protein